MRGWGDVSCQLGFNQKCFDEVNTLEVGMEMGSISKSLSFQLIAEQGQNGC